MSVVDSADLDVLPPFDFDPRTRVVFGCGSIVRLGELARELGGSKILFVTDPGIERAGHAAKGVASLIDSGLDISVFHDVQPNPTTDDVDRGLLVARQNNVDLIVAVGGGSAMDCAKGINFLLTNGGQVKDYWGVGKAKKSMLPLIAIPTTAGTGSEAQSFAIIADSTTHMKMACGDKKAAARIAILDPDLTLSMPTSVTATTGIDAISHAVESFVTTKRNAISQLFARRAWRLLAQAFPVVTADHSNLLVSASAPGSDDQHAQEIKTCGGTRKYVARFTSRRCRDRKLHARGHTCPRKSVDSPFQCDTWGCHRGHASPCDPIQCSRRRLIVWPTGGRSWSLSPG